MDFSSFGFETVYNKLLIMKRCSYCGAQNEDDNLFCTECGKELPKGFVCPSCGTCLDAGDKFCSNCGKKIEEQVVPDDSLSLLRKCSNCGTVLDEDDMFCSSCGKKVEEHTLETQEVQQSKCYNCGVLLEEDDVYCPNCGNKYEFKTPSLGSENTDISDTETNIESTQEDSKPILVNNESNNLSYNINDEEGKSADNIIAGKAKTMNLRKLSSVVAGLIMLAAIGYGCWYGLNTLFDNQQSANKDSVNHESSYLKDLLKPEKFMKEYNEKLANSASSDNKQDFNDEAMKKAKEIQRIMVDINNIYNRFLRNGGTNRDVGMYAMADIASKQQEGDMVFRELISLARKEGKQDMISSIQKEKEMFDEKAQDMTITIRNIINN